MTPPGKEIAVRCRGLTRTYGAGEGAVKALRGVDLDVRSGEMLMLLGPSGCGKTTLISIITAILDQDEGSCEVLGHDLRRMNQSERARLRREEVGFVFQAFNLLPALSALENVSVPLLIKGMSQVLAEKNARETLASVGLGARIDAPPARLSGGEQQRVAIARALVHKPRLVVCDEPTSNLDTTTGHEMMGILRDLADTPDRALIVVTHDTRILNFADRIARMEDGRVVDASTGSVGPEVAS